MCPVPNRLQPFQVGRRSVHHGKQLIQVERSLVGGRVCGVKVPIQVWVVLGQPGGEIQVLLENSDVVQVDVQTVGLDHLSEAEEHRDGQVNRLVELVATEAEVAEDPPRAEEL